MKKTAGFTLVEILVVVAILSILAAMAVPTFSNSIQKSQESQCLANRTIIERADSVYAETRGSVNAIPGPHQVRVASFARFMAMGKQLSL